MNTDDVIARAFSAGSDARLAGQPMDACPYLCQNARAAWREGWMHVAEWWGRDANRPVRPLPDVALRYVGNTN